MLLSHLCAFAWANTVPTVVMSNAIGISFHHFSNELSVSLFFHSKEKFSVTIFFCSSFLSYTNYAKIDRIEHKEIEKFKTHVLNTDFHGMTIKQWSNIFSSKDEAKLEYALKTLL